MQDQPDERATSRSFSKKLILVLEQDEPIGTQLAQMIRQEIAYQAFLARNLSEAHRLLAHLKCDLLVLVDETFPEEDLEHLSLLPAAIEPPELIGLTFFSWTSNGQNTRDVRNIVKAVKLFLLSVMVLPSTSERWTTFD